MCGIGAEKQRVASDIDLRHVTATVWTLAVLRQCPAYAFDIFSNVGHSKNQVVFAHAEKLRPIGHFVRLSHIDAASRYRR
jgi:hypothetical protein